jgi:hypothetical protein
VNKLFPEGRDLQGLHDKLTCVGPHAYNNSGPPPGWATVTFAASSPELAAGTAATVTAPYGRPSSITRAGDGRVVVAYTRVSFVPEHGGVERAFLRFIDTSGPRKRRSAR